MGDATSIARANGWRAHLTAYLTAAGGLAGPARPATPSRPPGPSTPSPDFYPRGGRFCGRYDFEFPPHVVYNDPRVPADERNLALLAKRTLEMDVPEMMASILVERADQPWEFHLDYSRQLWDETRHAMMGSVAFEARGVDWTRIPLNVGSRRLNLFATPLERRRPLRHQKPLMPAETANAEYQTASRHGIALGPISTTTNGQGLHRRAARRWQNARNLHEDALEQRRHPRPDLGPAPIQSTTARTGGRFVSGAREARARKPEDGRAQISGVGASRMKRPPDRRPTDSPTVDLPLFRTPTGPQWLPHRAASRRGWFGLSEMLGS